MLMTILALASFIFSDRNGKVPEEGDDDKTER